MAHGELIEQILDTVSALSAQPAQPLAEHHLGEHDDCPECLSIMAQIEHEARMSGAEEAVAYYENIPNIKALQEQWQMMQSTVHIVAADTEAED